MITIARYLLFLGLLLLLLGGIFYGLGRAGISFGRIPGDFQIERNNFTCVFALGTSLVLSIILSIILNILVRFLDK